MSHILLKHNFDGMHFLDIISEYAEDKLPFIGVCKNFWDKRVKLYEDSLEKYELYCIELREIVHFEKKYNDIYNKYHSAVFILNYHNIIDETTYVISEHKPYFETYNYIMDWVLPQLNKEIPGKITNNIISFMNTKTNLDNIWKDWEALKKSKKHLYSKLNIKKIDEYRYEAICSNLFTHINRKIYRLQHSTKTEKHPQLRDDIKRLEECYRSIKKSNFTVPAEIALQNTKDKILCIEKLIKCLKCNLDLENINVGYLDLGRSDYKEITSEREIHNGIEYKFVCEIRNKYLYNLFLSLFINGYNINVDFKNGKVICNNFKKSGYAPGNRDIAIYKKINNKNFKVVIYAKNILIQRHYVEKYQDLDKYIEIHFDND